MLRLYDQPKDLAFEIEIENYIIAGILPASSDSLDKFKNKISSVARYYPHIIELIETHVRSCCLPFNEMQCVWPAIQNLPQNSRYASLAGLALGAIQFRSSLDLLSTAVM